MKYFIVILSCVLFIGGRGAVGASIDKTDILEGLSKCAEEAGASDDDMKKIVSHEIPESKNGLCTMSCFMKKYDMMTEENKMNIDGIKSFMKKVMTDHEDLPEKLITAMVDCNKELSVEEDECEAAKNIIECVMPKMREHMLGKKLLE